MDLNYYYSSDDLDGPHKGGALFINSDYNSVDYYIMPLIRQHLNHNIFEIHFAVWIMPL